MSLNRRTLLYDTVLLITAIGMYAPTLWYGFVGDDLIYFIGNPFIRSFDVITILRKGAIGFDYLPLRDLSFALDFLLWGERPFGFHLTNVLLFGITAVSIKHLFVLLNTHLTGQDGDRFQLTAAFAALLFVLHPTSREVVCVVYNRGALLTTLFCILSCLAYLRHMRESYQGRTAYVLALFSYILALLSREYGIILPMLLSLIVLCGDRAKVGTRLASLLPFYLAGAAFFLIYREYAVAATYIGTNETLLSGFPDKIAMAFRIIVFYLLRLVTFAGTFDVSKSAHFWYASIPATVALLAVVYRLRRTRPQLLVGYLFFLIGLMPVLNFYHTSPIVAPRYAFLPYLGLFFMLTSLTSKGREPLVPVAALVYTIIWTLSTIDQVGCYKTNVAYWENVALDVKSAFVYEQLGYAYYLEHKYQKALEALRKVTPMPPDPSYHMAVGNACMHLGDYDCAVSSFETAVRFGGGGPPNRGASYDHAPETAGRRGARAK